VQVAELSPFLRQAIRLTREAGLTESATELEERVFAAYTTSSEWLGEVGEAILHFRAREGRRIPADVAELLNQCLREVAKVWPRYGPELEGVGFWKRVLARGLDLLKVGYLP
jgi:hypothetical protein